jgi:5-(carboxyamino)imidazole ribonucleotide mutase
MIAIIMGSDSDLTVMSKASEILDKFNVPYEITIVSAHRTPDRMYNFAREAETRGIKVIIAGAGGAAHLPGMVASLTHLPVIGVPIKTSSLNGLDSLLSIVQMPAGIPVATVAINNAENAALLALSILCVYDENIAKRLKEYKENLKKTIEEKAKRLESIGYKSYIDETGIKN